MSQSRSLPAGALGPAALPVGPGRLADWLGTTVELLLVLTAGVMALRRAAGHLTRPPDTASLLIVGLAAAGVLVMRGPWRRHLPRGASALPPAVALSPLAAYVPAAAVLLLCGALTTPGISAAALAVLWGPPALEEIWRAVERLRARRRRLPARIVAIEAADDGPADGRGDEAMPEHVTQQQTRFRADDGRESIAGWIRVSFQAGQRTAAAHLAFCPPLERVPQMSVRQLSGPAARLKTAQLLPHGVRVELKLDATTAEPADVVLKFAATCPAAAE